jgi:hypothetical protein
LHRFIGGFEWSLAGESGLNLNSNVSAGLFLEKKILVMLAEDGLEVVIDNKV